MTGQFIVRARKVMTNPLLDRKQFSIEVIHEGAAGPSRKNVQTIVAQKFKTNAEHVVVMNLRTQFGGNKSTALGLIYSSKDAMMKFEPKYRLIKQGLVEKPKIKTNRKTKKELKNKIRKLRGMEKVKARNFGKKK
jgi:small subunit ribosomal protein S24e